MTADMAPQLLAQSTGVWRAVYWEPVMGGAEKICVGCLTTFRGVTRAHLALKPGVLHCMYGEAGGAAENLLRKGFEMMNLLGATLDSNEMVSPFVGTAFGAASAARVHTEEELVHVALLMSSSMCSISDPGQLDAADEPGDGAKGVNHQFITRVRQEVAAIRPQLAPFFNIQARLLSKKRPVRFGFLSDRLVAHLGLLQATGLNGSVRHVRGLMTEVRMAHVAREGQGSAGIVVGFPPLNSASLGTKDRDAVRDCLEELSLEATELGVSFTSGDTDLACAQGLIEMA